MNANIASLQQAIDYYTSQLYKYSRYQHVPIILKHIKTCHKMRNMYIKKREGELHENQSGFFKAV